MADNLTTQSTTPATVPAASVIATDDVGGVHFQKVKLDLGGDGATTPVSGSVPVNDNGGALSVDDGGGSLTVDGTFWQATQPVSAAALPLPAGASTETTLAAVNTATGAQADAEASGNGSIIAILKRLRTLLSGGLPAALAAGGGLKVEGVAGGVAQPVSGTFWQATQPVSGTFWQATQPVSIAAAVDVTPAVPAAGDYLPVRLTNGGSFDPGFVVVGDTPNDAVDPGGNPVKIGGVARSLITIPTAVAAGDRVQQWHDLNGAIVIRERTLPTYSAVFRLAARPYPLSNVFAAAGRKQYAVIWHPVGATKHVYITEVLVAVRSISAAAIVVADLMKLTAATTPATGNPAITPRPHNTGAGAAEATCLALPTTAGTEETGSVAGSVQVETAAVTPAVGSTAPPVVTTQWLSLYRNDADPNSQQLIMRAATAEGWAVVFDSNAAATVTGEVIIRFMEEPA